MTEMENRYMANYTGRDCSILLRREDYIPEVQEQENL